jgi:DNA-directed RNA polymerase specialized sigma24 family protein
MDKEPDVLALVADFKEADEEERLRLGVEILLIIGPRLQRYLFAFCPDGWEDVFKATEVAIFKGLDGFNTMNEKAFRSWYFTICINLRNMRIRKLCSERKMLIKEEEYWKVVVAGELKAGLSAGDKLDVEYFMELLDKLKPGCFALIFKRFALQLEFKTIANDYGISEWTATKRTARCLEFARSLV